MKTEFHPANERGHADHGWLDTYHSFSFAEYFNPLRERFGALRVLNDDIVRGGTGFGKHSHQDMEIISIPLAGSLEHRDSMGHSEVIGPLDVQVMSAGTGIYHSEFNYKKDEPVNFLQLWVHPREKNIQPRYDQRTFDQGDWNNAVHILVTPDKESKAGGLWICQDAWISRAALQPGTSLPYPLHLPGNRVFVFVIKGEIMIENQAAGKRDAIGVMDTALFMIQSMSDSDILIIEVPER
jgi:quercetin 2,3-dioxygenase